MGRWKGKGRRKVGESVKILKNKWMLKKNSKIGKKKDNDVDAEMA